MTSIADYHLTQIFRYGARPELFTVASGAYLSSISFGTSAIPQVSYNNLTLPYGSTQINTTTGNSFDSETFSTYRKYGNIIVFNVNIDVKSSTVPQPYTGALVTGSELRIRNLLPSTSTIGGVGTINDPSGLMSRSWAPLRSGSMPPVFRDVQIYTINLSSTPAIWTPVQFSSLIVPRLSTGTTYDLGARLLSDDTFALFYSTFDTFPGAQYSEVPIAYEDFNSIADIHSSPSANIFTRIIIKGEYFSA